MLYRLLRPLIFQWDAERAHHGAIGLLRRMQKSALFRGACQTAFVRKARELEQSFWGVRFPNPIGLAAGWDKNGEVIDGLGCLGFGFVEAGTLTARPQPGNERPRIFRLPTDRALVNRLGFNNVGVERAVENLARRRRSLPLGINLGKNRDTSAADAPADYCRAFEALWPYCDYAVLNVSSPNTPGLRDLQRIGPLRDIVQAVRETNKRVSTSQGGREVPLLVKVSPDLDLRDLESIAELAVEEHLSGLVAVNTTTSQSCLKRPASWEGGISGAPLADRATLVLRHLYKCYGCQLRFIGVGGVFSADDAYERICNGASLVQVYTGLIYEGPGLVKRIVRGLRKKLLRDGLTNIREAIGSKVRA